MSLVHGLFNLLGFLFMLFAAFFAGRHKMKVHHLFLVLSFLFIITAFTIFLFYTGGVVDFHCITGIIVVIILIFIALSGFLFRLRRLKRKIHKVFGIAGLIFLFLQLIYGFVKSLLL